MNMFVSDNCPIKSAQALDDKRVIKMCLETAQLLCTAINEEAGSQVTPYKSTHQRHPAALWCRESHANFLWLADHGLALCKEYTHRYGKTHKCEAIIKDIKDKKGNKNRHKDLLIPFANCAAHKGKNISYKHIEPTTEAYKHYLAVRWSIDKRFPMWTNRSMPDWIVYNKERDIFRVDLTLDLEYSTL